MENFAAMYTLLAFLITFIYLAKTILDRIEERIWHSRMDKLQQHKIGKYGYSGYSGTSGSSDGASGSSGCLIHYDKNKICRIINGRFNWRLEVDGEKITFNGSWNADYFEEHYLKLGYIVEKMKEL